MNEPLVSVLVLNYNGLEHLKECFDSLLNLKYQNLELIFIDNQSQDDSVKFMKENYKKVKIIELDKNYGFAQGNNIGMAHTNGEYIALLNMDTIVDENWITELVKVAQKSEKTGIVGGKFYHYDNKEIVGFAGSSSDKFGNLRQFGDLKKERGLFDFEMKAFFITGAGFLFKREVYNKIGLFDSRYYLYYEDVDFCWRAWISGYDVIYTPKAIIYHKPDLKREFEKSLKIRSWIEKFRLRTLLKNYELKNLFKILPNYFFQKSVNLYQYRKQKKGIISSLLIIYLKAIFWNLIHIFSLIKERIFVQANRLRGDDFIFRLMEELQELEMKLIASTKYKKN